MKRLLNTAIFHGVASVFLGLAIGALGFWSSLNQTQELIERTLMEKVHMLAMIGRDAPSIQDACALITSAHLSGSSLHPDDEYLCVVDSNGVVLVHTRRPETLWKNVLANPIFPDIKTDSANLGDLLRGHEDYVGGYTASNGDSQIAAFAYESTHDLLVGVHRSHAALTREVALGMLPLALGLLFVCGGLTPGALFFMHRAQTQALQMRAAAEKSRETAEMRYRELVHNANSIILRMDTEGRITFINQFAQSFLGYDEEEVLGLSVVGTIVPETDSLGDDMRAMIQSIVRHPEHHINNQNENIRKNGERVWVSWTNKAILDEQGALREVLCIGNDMTAMREKKEELRRLATAIEQADEVIILSDLYGIVSYANPALTKVSGYEVEDFIGQPFTMLASEHTSPAVLEDLWRTLGREEAWRGEWVNRRKDGGLYYEEVAVSPVRDALGCITGYVLAQRDVTVQREMQERLRRVHALEVVGQLAGGVAHDFNNLLQAIEGYTELAIQDIPKDCQAVPFLEAAMQATDRAAVLVRQLLAFSRRETLQLGKVDLGAAVAAALPRLREVLGDAIPLDFRAEPGLWRTWADAGQIEFVLTNLCQNAREAMPSGGLVRISVSNVALTPEYRRKRPWAMDGEFVRVMVSDTGPGIPRHDLEHVFEPFFTTKEFGKGVGLGLATVYGAVKQHGGMVDVESPSGRGAIISLYFPREVKIAVSALPPAPNIAVDPDGRRRRGILLAEDEELVRNMAAEVLRRAGFNVICACDGSEARALYAAHADHIALAVLDVVMPRGTGRDVAEEIRAANPNLPIIFCTGFSRDLLCGDGLVGGGVVIVQKPYSPRELVGQVFALLPEEPSVEVN